jgi:hypothetical protein
MVLIKSDKKYSIFTYNSRIISDKYRIQFHDTGTRIDLALLKPIAWLAVSALTGGDVEE